MLLMMHVDRFILETWRFTDFEKTFQLAYDNEGFFTYPLFLYATAILVAGTKHMLRESFERVMYLPLYLGVGASLILGYDLIYRVRLILSLSLIAMAGCISIGTCLKMGEKEREKKYESTKEKKARKLLKSQKDLQNHVSEKLTNYK